MLHCLPYSAWADGILAEAARQLGKVVEHPNQRQPNPTQDHEQMGLLVELLSRCTDQREKVEQEVAVFPDDVESPAAEVDEIVELLARPVAAVDHVHLQSSR